MLNYRSNQTVVRAKQGKALESIFLKFKLNVIFYVLSMVTDSLLVHCVRQTLKSQILDAGVSGKGLVWLNSRYHDR